MLNNPVAASVRPLSDAAVVCRSSQASRNQISQINISRIARAVVSDGDFKGNDVAFVRSCITAGECFDSDQVGCIINNIDCFFQVITDS